MAFLIDANFRHCSLIKVTVMDSIAMKIVMLLRFLDLNSFFSTLFCMRLSHYGIADFSPWE
jgi:hypothetical protein